MPVRQYVGARYVPTFATPYEWQENTEYEALTNVSYNNKNYCSKKPVPANIGNPDNNSEYWVKTLDLGKLESEITTFMDNTNNAIVVLDDANTDITNKLNNAVNKGNVILLGGPYYITNTINIPSFHSIYSNGTTLNCRGNNFSNNFAVVLGTNTNTQPRFPQTKIDSVNINCNKLVSGIDVEQQRSYINGCEICGPKSYGIYIYYDKHNNPGDCDLTNNIIIGNGPETDKYECGIYVNGSDCNIVNLRTMGSKTGIYASNNANNLQLTNVHLLPYGNEINDWNETIGLHTFVSVYFDKLYLDNFRYGIVTEENGKVEGGTLFSYYYSNLTYAPTVLDARNDISVFPPNIANFRYNPLTTIGLNIHEPISLTENFNSVKLLSRSNTTISSDPATISSVKGVNSSGYYNTNAEKPLFIMPKQLNNVHAHAIITFNSADMQLYVNNVGGGVVNSSSAVYYNKNTTAAHPDVTIKSYNVNDGILFTMLVADNYDIGTVYINSDSPVYICSGNESIPSNGNTSTVRNIYA